MDKRAELKPVTPTPPELKPTRPPGAQAWAAFCRKLEHAGDLLFSTDYIEDPVMEAETLRYLVREVRGHLDAQVNHGDPDFPRFFRWDEPGSGPTAPNLDNWYLMARIRGGVAYRVTIEPGQVFDFLIGVLDAQTRNLGDHTREAFEPEPDGRIEITFSAERQGRNWIPLPDDAIMMLLRVYYHDWPRERPPAVRIERIGSAGEAPPPPTLERLSGQLDAVIGALTRQPYGYAFYQLRAMDEAPANSFPPPLDMPGGGGPIIYGFGRYRLTPEEALIIEFQPPTARYWGLHTYTLPWFSNVDPANRVSSLNDLQAHVDTDGRVRVVVAHGDPGVQNWLDAGGFPTGSMAYRWIWSESPPPPVTTRLVPLAEVRASLPAETPAFTREDRVRQIQERREHLARRFRF